MAGQVQVDTALMLSTAQQSSNIAGNMITHAKTLSAGIDYVMTTWTGQAGDAFRNTMGVQKPMLDQLIQKLQTVSDTINQGAQGLDSQDTSGRANLNSQGQTFLNGSLNK
jgi:WXG100 family type VII secretion target